MTNALLREEIPVSGGKMHMGWFAVPEEGLRTIERTFDSEGARRKAFAAYYTLLRVANLTGSPRFVRSISSLARDMSYCYSQAAEGIALLESAGLCTVKRNYVRDSRELAPSEYCVETFPEFRGTSKSDVPHLPEVGPFTENSQELLQEPPISTKNKKEISTTTPEEGTSVPNSDSLSSSFEIAVGWKDLPPALATDAFKAAWTDYARLYHAKEKDWGRLHSLSILAQWKEMALWGEAEAIAAIQYSVRNSYRGIFQQKPHGHGTLSGAIPAAATAAPKGKYEW
ncbi:MAG: hypothetical protein ABI254_05595 [Chthoniobacterales bacterium]